MINANQPLTDLLTHSELCRIIGAKAKALRKRKSISRASLSKMSGVSTATIGRFENQGTATLSVMLKIAEALGALQTFESLFKVEIYSSLDEFERG